MREEVHRRGVPRARSRREGVRVFVPISPAVEHWVVCVKRATVALSPLSARSGPGESDRAHAGTRDDSPLRAVEIALDLAHRAHVRDTTREKRSPDHHEAIGAPVHQLVAELETRRNGSPRGSLRRSGPGEGAGASGGSRRGPGDRGLPRAPRVNQRRGPEPRRYDEAAATGTEHCQASRSSRSTTGSTSSSPPARAAS